MRRFLILDLLGSRDARGRATPRRCAGRIRPPRRGLHRLRRAVGRPGDLRGALRPRRPLPCLELRLSGLGRRSNAVCWLKNEVPKRVENPCCVSGIKGAGVQEPRKDATARSSSASTGSAATTAISTSSPIRPATPARPPARGRTAAAPGPITSARLSRPGDSARCYLKDRLSPPRRKPCCVSGVVR